MSRDSTHARLERIRPPRVRLAYDVEIGGAIERKELPFVVGVLGDFGGRPDPTRPARRLRDRRFVAIDVDNFDQVMQATAPAASFGVRNVLGGGGELPVSLTFRRFDDFRPEAVARQVPALNALLAARMRLADLRNRLSGNERLEDALVQALHDDARLRQLGHEAAEAAE